MARRGLLALATLLTTALLAVPAKAADCTTFPRLPQITNLRVEPRLVPVAADGTTTANVLFDLTSPFGGASFEFYLLDWGLTPVARLIPEPMFNCGPKVVPLQPRTSSGPYRLRANHYYVLLLRSWPFDNISPKIYFDSFSRMRSVWFITRAE